MISIIICSTKEDINPIIRENISKTIGVSFEIIIINNSNNNYSIFSAYNEGIKRAKYSILCFIHEDIVFRSNNWGYLICKAFDSDTSLGMIGVIGATMIFDLSWGWWSAPQVGKIIQSHKSKKITSEYTKCLDEQPILSDAAICDGLFLSFPKSIFDKIMFDEDTYKGFHGYDMDISMQLLTSGYKIKILENVLIEHFSWGNINDSFIDACYKFYNKWRNQLPISCLNKETLDIEREKYLKGIIGFCPQKALLNSRFWKAYNRIIKKYYCLKKFFSK